MLKNDILKKINNEDREILKKKINAGINYDNNKYSNPKPDIRIILNKKIRSNSMLKNIIKKMEEKIKSNDGYTNLGMLTEKLREESNVYADLLPDLKKEAELQEEMAKAFVNCIKFFTDCPCSPNMKRNNCEASECKIFSYIELIEKYYNKKWEEIIKDGE